MKVIFLDRDGVINNYPGFGDYIKSWQEFEFLPGVLAAIKKLTDSDLDIFVISNQAGVAKGIYTQSDLDDITDNMLRQIQKEGGRVRGVFYCVHEDKDNCNCRKPKTGLFKKALKTINIDSLDSNTNGTYFVGDSIRDVEAGKNANLKTILVLSGQETKDNKDNWKLKPDLVAGDLLSAVDVVLNNNS